MYGTSSTQESFEYGSAASLPFPIDPAATSYASSGCSSCYDSPASCLAAPSGGGDLPGACLMQGSFCSHDLLQRINGHYENYSLCPYSSTCGFVDQDDDPVRRVYSANDLQHRVNGAMSTMIMDSCGYKRSESPPLPLRSESSLMIEGMSRAGRCSPKERKEKIERYRIKKHKRNFNKKIKYACRKTLADSRPRIRGRFARNDEPDGKSTSPEMEEHWNLQMGGEDDELDEEDDNWISFINAFSSSGNSIIP
ncbi:hypothetical protein SAY87_020446 [Trapa incisa]|uniref:CCT domain-containing protein n=2 Tax=Trapa TaxID=22665 RepID=A0AAN7M8Y1_TRANT|nr:hypothetical protein SAY87_020446 [Trapa incisa]KAK4792096.1 hypothetical protein SAY86_022531 [Trapa natans]